ncbi:hypothetical protein PECL_969 [Pediococcus claussenii ATCC BAA-344]|uniref:Uncharacterized protein n=1 Tax=Pediococcus claussenii (strain ATCC BAA-344 / DSM 14800 / JCM 18046 / KCTC 3811 / LMG 21948 / P06) TaxID=701521 RepID=G8PDA3_PEDCP|nr:hypothetical protein PECL_969 [Pediococcus claussenii ATCC BAA-344]
MDEYISFDIANGYFLKTALFGLKWFSHLTDYYSPLILVSKHFNPSVPKSKTK